MQLHMGEILYRQQSRILIGIAATGSCGWWLNGLEWTAGRGGLGLVRSDGSRLVGVVCPDRGSVAKRRYRTRYWAALSMSAALAFGEPLAANVVAVMYAGGQLPDPDLAGLDFDCPIIRRPPAGRLDLDQRDGRFAPARRARPDTTLDSCQVRMARTR